MTLLGSMDIANPESDKDVVKIFLNGLLKPLRNQIKHEILTDPGMNVHYMDLANAQARAKFHETKLDTAHDHGYLKGYFELGENFVYTS